VTCDTEQDEQIVIFIVQHLFDPEEDHEGFLLLRCFRSFLELDMYASFEVHTEKTIEEGRAELQRFAALMTVRT
jgi:hypothetical protein